ncbi:MAG: hypothetical protein JW754_02375 [Candidatus Aenigmarchaeota archaeon]|nr:hypothetical protein [Candidatus Aenigmarchaeota archaeon]
MKFSGPDQMACDWFYLLGINGYRIVDFAEKRTSIGMRLSFYDIEKHPAYHTEDEMTEEDMAKLQRYGFVPLI